MLKDNFFDFIWCSGVLHHTKSPIEAFRITTKSLKNGGYILIGLYNKIGRIRTLIRKFFYNIFGENFLKIIDPKQNVTSLRVNYVTHDMQWALQDFYFTTALSTRFL